MMSAHIGFGRLIRRAVIFLIISLCMVLFGCGGSTQHLLNKSNSEPAESQVSSDLVETSQAVRAQAIQLLSFSWATLCDNRQITTLRFTPSKLVTQTVFYKDDNCLDVRQELQRKHIEIYTIGRQVVDATGVIATEIDLETVLSKRYDRFVFENGALYFGLQQAKASYRTEMIDFKRPYFSVQ